MPPRPKREAERAAAGGAAASLSPSKGGMEGGTCRALVPGSGLELSPYYHLCDEA